MQKTGKHHDHMIDMQIPPLEYLSDEMREKL